MGQHAILCQNTGSLDSFVFEAPCDAVKHRASACRLRCLGGLCEGVRYQTELFNEGPCCPQAPIPKQYLDLLGSPIATYSLRTFGAMPEVGEIIVVCEPEYRCASKRAYSFLNP